jgi:hypothetical protein
MTEKQDFLRPCILQQHVTNGKKTIHVIDSNKLMRMIMILKIKELAILTMTKITKKGTYG